MDSVFVGRWMARVVVGFGFILFTACGPLAEQPVTEGDTKSPGTKTPGTTPGTPPADVPESPVALVAALWEKPHPDDGPDWTSYAFEVVRDYGANLIAGTSDTKDFCPAYSTLNKDQKISFWVYLVSAMTKYESGFDPTNRYKESTMGTDPVTKQPVYSEGLLQLSYQDSRNYSFCNQFDWEKDKLLSPRDPRKTILDPYKNLNCGIRILNQIVGSHKAIAFGSGHYWAVLKSSSSHHRIKEIQALTNQILFCRK